MNLDGLQRLIYLCQIKNDLNRKRRRFYYYWNTPDLIRKCECKLKTWKGGDCKATAPYRCRGTKHIKSGPKHITPAEAGDGYIKAQKDMKAMTRDMRKMRVDCGVRFIWNDGGLIEAIELGSGRRIKQTQFKKYYEAEVFEMELFGGK